MPEFDFAKFDDRQLVDAFQQIKGDPARLNDAQLISNELVDRNRKNVVANLGVGSSLINAADNFTESVGATAEEIGILAGNQTLQDFGKKSQEAISSGTRPDATSVVSSFIESDERDLFTSEGAKAVGLAALEQLGFTVGSLAAGVAVTAATGNPALGIGAGMLANFGFVFGPTLKQRRHNNEDGELSGADYGIALASSGASSFIEGIANTFLPGGGRMATDAVKKVLMAGPIKKAFVRAATEGTTETAQEFIEAMGGMLATDLGVDFDQAKNQALTGLVLGATTGGGLSAGVSTAQGIGAGFSATREAGAALGRVATRVNTDLEEEFRQNPELFMSKVRALKLVQGADASSLKSGTTDTDLVNGVKTAHRALKERMQTLRDRLASNGLIDNDLKKQLTNAINTAATHNRNLIDNGAENNFLSGPLEEIANSDLDADTKRILRESLLDLNVLAWNSIGKRQRGPAERAGRAIGGLRGAGLSSMALAVGGMGAGVPVTAPLLIMAPKIGSAIDKFLGLQQPQFMLEAPARLALADRLGLQVEPAVELENLTAGLKDFKVVQIPRVSGVAQELLDLNRQRGVTGLGGWPQRYWEIIRNLRLPDTGEQPFTDVEMEQILQQMQGLRDERKVDGASSKALSTLDEVIATPTGTITDEKIYYSIQDGLVDFMLRQNGTPVSNTQLRRMIVEANNAVTAPGGVNASVQATIDLAGEARSVGLDIVEASNIDENRKSHLKSIILQIAGEKSAPRKQEYFDNALAEAEDEHERQVVNDAVGPIAQIGGTDRGTLQSNALGFNPDTGALFDPVGQNNLNKSEFEEMRAAKPSTGQRGRLKKAKFGVTTRIAPWLQDAPDGTEPAKGLSIASNVATVSAAISNIDKIPALMDKHTDVLSSQDAWKAFHVDLGGNAVSLIPPLPMITNVAIPSLWRNKMESLDTASIDNVSRGLETTKEIGAAYANGTAQPSLTGVTLFWSILSREASPFDQEGMALNVFADTEEFNRLKGFIDKAMAGRFDFGTSSAYNKFAERIADKVAGLPGERVKNNLNAFGTFLEKMGISEGNQRSPMMQMHQWLIDDVSSVDIRRRFHKFAKKPGIDNKILSFWLLISGRDDIIILDRVQINNMWADERFEGMNIATGLKSVNGTGIEEFARAPQGLALYEAIENSLAPRIKSLYEQMGRSEDGTLGRYHWESWLLGGNADVEHASLSAITNMIGDKPDIWDGAYVRDGNFDNYTYGAAYFVDHRGRQGFIVKDGRGIPYRFLPDKFKEFTNYIKKPSNGVVPSGFSIRRAVEESSRPWMESSDANQDKLDSAIKKFGRVISRDREGAIAETFLADLAFGTKLRGDELETFQTVRAGFPRGLSVQAAEGNGPFRREDTRALRRLGVNGTALVLDPNVRKAFKAAGIAAPNIFELETTDKGAITFRQAISEATRNRAVGLAAQIKSKSEYEGMRLFLTEDGKAGFALDGGDIVSAFTNKSISGQSMAYPLLLAAIGRGGRLLDAFDTVLPDIYSEAGFRAISRIAFSDEAFLENHTREELNTFKETFKDFNKGSPDIVFMAYDDRSYDGYLPGEGRLFDTFDAAKEAQLDAVTRLQSGGQILPLQVQPSSVEQLTQGVPQTNQPPGAYVSTEESVVNRMLRRADTLLPLVQPGVAQDSANRFVASLRVGRRPKGLSDREIFSLAYILADIMAVGAGDLGQSDAVQGFVRSQLAPLGGRLEMRVRGGDGSIVEVFSHELGHLIDHRVGLSAMLRKLKTTDPAMAKKLVSQMEAVSKDRRPDLWLPGSQDLFGDNGGRDVAAYRIDTREVFADNVASFLTNPDRYLKQAPDAAKFLMDTVRKSKINNYLRFIPALAGVALPAILAQVLVAGLPGDDEDDVEGIAA